MTSPAELEAQLEGPRDRWDRGTLAVYADVLQAHGDPRGELIAIDLAIEANGPTPQLDVRRRQLLFAWLGDNVAPKVRSHRFGMIDLDPWKLEFALEQPFARYLMGLRLAGERHVLQHNL